MEGFPTGFPVYAKKSDGYVERTNTYEPPEQEHAEKYTWPSKLGRLGYTYTI